MAKKKSNKKTDESSETTDAAADQAARPSTTSAPSPVANDDEEEMDLLQVELGDMVKMKQVLDEAVIAAVTETLPEDTSWDNWKLALMLASCIFAMIAQFALSLSRVTTGIGRMWITLLCVLSGILQLVATYIDQNAILWTTPTTTAASDSSSNNNSKNAVCVRSNLPRFFGILYYRWYT